MDVLICIRSEVIWGRNKFFSKLSQCKISLIFVSSFGCVWWKEQICLFKSSFKLQQPVYFCDSFTVIFFVLGLCNKWLCLRWELNHQHHHPSKLNSWKHLKNKVYASLRIFNLSGSCSFNGIELNFTLKPGQKSVFQYQKHMDASL